MTPKEELFQQIQSKKLDAMLKAYEKVKKIYKNRDKRWRKKHK